MLMCYKDRKKGSAYGPVNTLIYHKKCMSLPFYLLTVFKIVVLHVVS
jgi:hypothetical protein